jgi:hypothetical protein
MGVRRRIARLIAIFVVIGGGIVGVAAAPAHALSCHDGWLRSDANHKYVSVELGYGTTSPYRGMLRARASSVGPWERFEFCWGVQNNPATWRFDRSLTANGSLRSSAAQVRIAGCFGLAPPVLALGRLLAG